MPRRAPRGARRISCRGYQRHCHIARRRRVCGLLIMQTQVKLNGDKGRTHHSHHHPRSPPNSLGKLSSELLCCSTCSHGQRELMCSLHSLALAHLLRVITSSPVAGRGVFAARLARSALLRRSFWSTAACLDCRLLKVEGVGRTTAGQQPSTSAAASSAPPSPTDRIAPRRQRCSAVSLPGRCSHSKSHRSLFHSRRSRGWKAAACGRLSQRGDGEAQSALQKTSLISAAAAGTVAVAAIQLGSLQQPAEHLTCSWLTLEGMCWTSG